MRMSVAFKVSPCQFVACFCVTVVSFAPSSAADRTFVAHTINKDSAFSACAAIDVNKDGKLDIVSGGFWYEAPAWKKHFLREVEQIRGRYDDYSNLPLDVNGDGWLDLVSVNYRSQSLYWVEHPGEKIKADPASPWKKHVIDTPGPMETGRLVDVDGDGKLDVLPNGTTFAAWWELQNEKNSAGKTEPRWVKHELPNELAGHGIGQGDINGDGRQDLVGPAGWLEAPEDRRKGRWTWHAEFTTHPDGSIPILVFDVDEDGDADIVYGRGHNIGLYWLEQSRDSGVRLWERHAIDTSWSQPHSLLLADLDGDKKLEVVAGKRYLGHDGRDPGEYDPLAAYSYQFDKQRRTWRRMTVNDGAMIGFALDPKAADLDGDGDLDLIASDACGLYWLENRPADPSAAAAAKTPAYADHAKLLAFHDGAPVKTPFDWGLRRRHILLGMEEAMGPLPDSSRRVPLDVKVLEQTGTPKYLRRKITFQAESGDRVPAYLLIPCDALVVPNKLPAMLCLHQTTGIGKGEPAGLGGLSSLHYAHELAERGFVCLVPDYPSFGDYKYDFKTQGKDYVSGSMKAIWNNHRAVDLLEELPEVDPSKIGVIGHSLGGHNSLFTAAFDQRLRAVVTSCGFTAFHHYYGGKLAGWTSDRYMPRIRDVYGNEPGRVPFDFYGVLAAIAPRPIFVCAPERDDNFDVTGVKKVVAEVDKVYEFLGAKERIHAAYPASAHDFPEAERMAAYEWLKKVLK